MRTDRCLRSIKYYLSKREPWHSGQKSAQIEPTNNTTALISQAVGMLKVPAFFRFDEVNTAAFALLKGEAARSNNSQPATGVYAKTAILGRLGVSCSS